jgi:hypothetical protein
MDRCWLTEEMDYAEERNCTGKMRYTEKMNHAKSIWHIWQEHRQVGIAISI